MNTRLLMASSAVFMGASGLCALFLPAEILHALNLPFSIFISLFIQMLGIVLAALALLNWTAKGILIGGIYARPVALANLMHFMTGALTLLKVTLAGDGFSALWLITLLYAVFAFCFVRVAFTHPGKANADTI